MSLTFIDVAHPNQRPFDFYTNTISLRLTRLTKSKLNMLQNYHWDNRLLTQCIKHIFFAGYENRK
jgi:hypothetical protein